MTLAKELEFASPILSDLDVRFAAMLAKKKLNIVGIELCENTFFFGIPIGKVVNQDSASRYFGKKTIIPGSDHSTIVKPCSVNDHAHQVLYDFLCEHKFINLGHEKVLPKYPSLFDRYSPDFEKYYIERHADKMLKGYFENYSIWIFGESGVGKTAAISRVLYSMNIRNKYISLGAGIGLSANDLLKDIYIALVEDPVVDIQAFSVTETIELISRVMEDNGRDTPYCLFLEEIPISNVNTFRKFSEYIYAIIMRVKDRARLKVVLTSIYEPNMTPIPEQIKISEKLKVIEWAHWSNVELNCLIETISEDTGVASDIIDIDKLDGSPRCTKNIFRDVLSKG